MIAEKQKLSCTGLKSGLKLKGLKMKNEQLKLIADLIRFDWEMNHRNEDEIRHYARACGYCWNTAEQFIFDEYLENFCVKGKPTYQWDGLVDSVMLKNGYQMDDIYDMTELDYQLIWGYINQDITDEVNKNIWLDRPVLAMIK